MCFVLFAIWLGVFLGVGVGGSWFYFFIFLFFLLIK